MNKDPKELEKIVANAIVGKGAHVSGENALDGLDWKLAGARPDGWPFSIFQLLNHTIYWQDWAVSWMDGKKPAIPKQASGSWPGNIKPASKKVWEAAAKRFLEGQKQLRKRCAGSDLWKSSPWLEEGEQSHIEMLLTIALHNSYHTGQIVALRRALGSWPPPAGGLTW